MRRAPAVLLAVLGFSREALAQGALAQGALAHDALARGAHEHQSALSPAGPQAASIGRLWWFALAVATAAYLLTLAALAIAARRARRREREAPDAAHELPDERGLVRGVTIGVGVTLAALIAFFSYDLAVGRTLNNPGVEHPLTIEVVGHQWWWEVHYADTTPQGRFTTANEIHVPVGRPVRLILTARDVIHSVWLPSLAGKKDMVPGYQQELWLQVDSAGTYRGQCAEFCGQQHAKMAMLIIAEPAAEYDRWVLAQRRDAAPPADSVAAAGQRVFAAATCAMCHAIGGTSAGSVAGPDLTHLASRTTLAAGSLPNTRQHLANWIVNPQRSKPGNHMPPNALAPRDLDALLTYLQGLR